MYIFLFKKQLYWINEWKQDCGHVGLNQLDPLYHLKSYTNIVLLFCVVVQALSDSKTRNILVYMTLNGKEGLTGCGLVYIGSHVLAPL